MAVCTAAVSLAVTLLAPRILFHGLLGCVPPAIYWREYYPLSNLVIDHISEASKDDNSKCIHIDLWCGGVASQLPVRTLTAPVFLSMNRFPETPKSEWWHPPVQTERT